MSSVQRCFREFLPVALAAMWGCADSSRSAVHPAGGKLLINGRAAAHAKIALHPLDARPSSLRPVAVAGVDGVFRLTTYDKEDGAPAGRYAVTLIWPDPTISVDECDGDLPHDLLKGAYADPLTTTLRATIVPGVNELRLVASQPGSWSTPRKAKNPN